MTVQNPVGYDARKYAARAAYCAGMLGLSNVWISIPLLVAVTYKAVATILF